jgi:prepilin peptidase CpaA
MSAQIVTIVGLFLITACWTDLRTMRIPNGITIIFAGAGLLYQASFEGVTGIESAAIGATVGMIPLYIMNRLGGIGGGDVKWFGAFGIWTGPLWTAQLLVISIVIAGGIAGLLLLLRLPGLRYWGARMKWPWGIHPVSSVRGAQYPFMIAVAPAFIILLGKG